jgi:selenocysteine lyase/cysteine desulfurase
MDLKNRLGIRHVMVKERSGRIELEELFAAVTARTRMIAISHVEFGSGYRSDLAAIGKFCRDRGILFCVDAIQSCGAMPVDVRAMNIDFLSAGAHKWLLGPEGLAIFYCRKELIESVHPEVGSMNVVKPQQYSPYDFTLKSDARRFECGAYNIAGTVGLGSSLELLLELGIDLVWKRIYALTTLLVEGLKEKGYQVYSPREKESECSGIVSFHSTTHDMDAIIQELESKRIIIVKRLGRLRAAPHFYQDQSHIDGLLNALPAH